MEFLILCLAELKALIASDYHSLHFTLDGNIRYISITDVLYEIESVKKNDIGGPVWQGITRKTSAFHSESQNGHVCCIDLDNYAIENALFEIGDDYQEVRLWEPAANRDITPEESARLICLKYIDNCYRTTLHKNALTTYYGI